VPSEKASGGVALGHSKSLSRKTAVDHGHPAPLSSSEGKKEKGTRIWKLIKTQMLYQQILSMMPNQQAEAPAGILLRGCVPKSPRSAMLAPCVCGTVQRERFRDQEVRP
jgi:hypothetical protein